MKWTIARRTRISLLVGLALLAGALVLLPTPAEAANPPRCFGKRATIVSRDRLIRGTNGADVIVARGAQPKRIYGRGGNDLICGSTGSRDRIYGGSGNDRIDGGGRGTLCYQQGGTGTIRRCAGPRRTLTVETFGEGRVASTPTGIDCGHKCSNRYYDGYWVSLVATPDAGMRFARWDGGCTGAGPCRVRMGAPRAVTATFEPEPDPEPESHQLIVVTDGDGEGTVSSDPAGIDCGVTCSAGFGHGTEVVLVAEADASSEFAGWSGHCEGTEEPQCTLTMDAAKSTTATFGLMTHELSVSVEGEGSVASEPAGISCGEDCAGSFGHGTTVALTAMPAEGWGLDTWTDCDTMDGDLCTVTMEADRAVTATFEPDPEPESHQLTVVTDGDGEGTVSSDPAGIDCGDTCSADFDHGTEVVLTAAPDPGSLFAGWDGAGCSGPGTCETTMDTARSVTATFDRLHDVTVAKGGSGSGSVASDPAGIDCGSVCTAAYPKDTVVTLTATPTGGAVFGGWTGCDEAVGPACTVATTEDRTVTATFTAVYALVVGVTGGGTVTSNPAGINCGSTCAGDYLDGTVVTLTATPNPLGAFLAWGGACTGAVGNTCQVAMTQARSVTATFIP